MTAVRPVLELSPGAASPVLAADGKLKRCSQCRKLKPFAEFNRHRSRPDGRQPYCRGCRRQRGKDSRASKKQAPVPVPVRVFAGPGVLLGALEDVRGGLSWRDAALCAQADPDAFFPEKGGSTRRAKLVCAACPVRAECLEYALGTAPEFGIWGGLTEVQRRRLLAARRPALEHVA